VAQTLFIRAPFASAAGADAPHYQVLEDFEVNGRIVIGVDHADPARLRLEPVFPGKLTFKPSAPGLVPADPSVLGAASIVGDLHLEIAALAAAELRIDVPSLSYALIVSYLGITVDPEFFLGTVLSTLAKPSGGFRDVFVGGVKLTTAAAIANAFGSGLIAIDLAPTKTTSRVVFPALKVDAATNQASVTIACGVRTVLGAAVVPPPVTQIATPNLLAAPAFAAIPLGFLYRLLKHAPRWSTIAAADHVGHPLFAALAAREEPAGRWRRLRLFPLGARTPTVRASAAFSNLQVRAAHPGSGAELWNETPNQVGEVYTKRPDNEAFRLTVQGPAGAIPIAPNVGDVRAPSLDLQWDAPPANAEPASIDVTVEVPVDAGAVYGGYDLKQGDKDGQQPTYGGVVRSAAAGDSLPAPGELGYVKQLQEDLRTLGFKILGVPDGGFGRRTTWAVREFQIYAKMASVAKWTLGEPSYVACLSATPNDRRYTGNIGGVANAETRALIQYWLANNWRCPVVVEAWDDARTQLNTTELWAHDDVTNSQLRVFARDFSGYYALPVGRNPNDYVVLGYYENAPPGGPVSMPGLNAAQPDPRHCWQPEAEVLPEHLVGAPLAALTAEQLSTFRVVRSVAEQECLGYFDSVNAYDAAVISVGPCHWTMSVYTNPPEEGELPAYLAYLADVEPAAFSSGFGFFGIRMNHRKSNANRSWTTAAGVRDGSDYWVPSSRKFTGWAQLQQDDGTFQNVPDNMADLSYFRSWHWFYRFQMAGRTIAAYRRRMWDMARLRIRSILTAPWGANGLTAPNPAGGTRPATIGDVFTSERSVALLTRWHVWQPGSIVAGGVAGPHLRDALAASGVLPGATTDTSAWTNAHELALAHAIFTVIDALIAAPPSMTAAEWTAFRATMRAIRDWPTWAGGPNPRAYSLANTIASHSLFRNSFGLDTTALPPPPP
jgi:peptidoglycan hydrolase-like protein with peptidoglycan-binding domain